MKIKALSVLVVSICLVAMTAPAQQAGEIVFSKSLIDATNPSGLSTEFAAGDQIYAMAILDKSLVDIVGKASAKQVGTEVFLYELKAPLYDYQQPSEAQLQTGTLRVSGNAMHATRVPLDIVPDPASMTAYASELSYKKFGPSFDGPVKFAIALSKLEAGKHEIIVKLRCNYNFVAEGKFTISGDGFGAYEQRSSAINAAADGAKTKDAVMPKAARTDKKLEQEMLAAFKGSNTYKDRINAEVKRIVIIDPDWMTRRHKITGAILHRYIRAAIAVKNKDGSCSVWQLVTFQQDYVSGKFQATRFDGIGDPYKIPCGSIGK